MYRTSSINRERYSSQICHRTGWAEDRTEAAIVAVPRKMPLFEADRSFLERSVGEGYDVIRHHHPRTRVLNTTSRAG